MYKHFILLQTFVFTTVKSFIALGPGLPWFAGANHKKLEYCIYYFL